MLKWPFSILTKSGPVLLIGYIAWQGWQNLGPNKPEIGPDRQVLADRIVPVIAQDVRVSRGDIRQVALLHFSNDPTDYFTDTLRRTVEQGGWCDLLDRTFAEKTRNALNVRHPSCSSPELAVLQGRDACAQGVIFGDIHAFEWSPSGVKIDVEVNMAEVPTGRIVFSKRYSEEGSSVSSPIGTLRDSATGVPWFRRFFGALLGILLLPVFTISFIRAMVHKESNKTNAFVLGIYTLADALFAWLFVGAVLNSLWSIMVFIIAVVLAFVYNVRIMTFALRLEGR